MAEAKVQVNVRLSPSLHARLVTETARRGSSMTEVVEEAISDYLAIVTPRGKGKT